MMFSSKSVLVVLVFLGLVGCTKKNVDQNVTGGTCYNLVINGGFEELSNPSICPTDISQTHLCAGLTLPTPSTTDYYHCCGSGHGSIPQNFTGYQYPVEGCAYVGCVVSAVPPDGYVEYVQLRLEHPLVVGQQYRVSLVASLADSSGMSVGPLGVAVAEEMVKEPDYVLAKGIKPVIEFKHLITNKDGWEKRGGTFIAKKPANYIIIGVFRKRTKMQTMQVAGGSKSYVDRGYVYLDDIQLECL